MQQTRKEEPIFTWQKENGTSGEYFDDMIVCWLYKQEQKWVNMDIKKGEEDFLVNIQRRE